MSSKSLLSGFDTGNFLSDKSITRPAPKPKASQTAWQRWEMSSVAQEVQAEAATPERPDIQPMEPILLINDAELAQLRLQAQTKGEAEGYDQGYARGQAEGLAAGLAAMDMQAEQLRLLTLALPAALLAAQNNVADDLLALALTVAKQVLGQALTTEPKAILALVNELLHAEPALSGAPQLLLHPEDAALVNEHLADDLKHAGWRIRSDAHITRGGCRVLATSGERDATLEARWERVAATVARHDAAGTLADAA